MNAHFALLARAREALKDFQHRFVFVGGATVSLHLDDPASEPARATKDVDLVVEAAGYVDFAALEEDLAETEVAVFVRGWLHNQGGDFLDAIAAHVGTYARARYLFEKVRDLDR